MKGFALGLAGLAGLLVGLPLLAITGAQRASAACVAGPTPAADGSPSILGPSMLTAAQIAAWWRSTNPGPDPVTTIGTPVDVLVADYVDGGTAEGVRGDIAFAQAVVETGAFTSSDATQRFNFAGIAHPDGASAGAPFASVAAGVTAQLQLLREVVLGNTAPLAEPKVAPNWAGRAGITTWAGLAGTWASASDYWTAISSVFLSMTAGTGLSVAPGYPPASCVGSGAVLVSQGALAALWPQILAYLEAQLGKPYVWGATGPDSFDCSGLVLRAFQSVGINLPRTSEAQFAATSASSVPYAGAQPGYLLFMEGNPPGHVAVFIGNGLMIEAPHTGDVVKIAPVPAAGLTGVTVP